MNEDKTSTYLRNVLDGFLSYSAEGILKRLILWQPEFSLNRCISYKNNVSFLVHYLNNKANVLNNYTNIFDISTIIIYIFHLFKTERQIALDDVCSARVFVLCHVLPS